MSFYLCTSYVGSVSTIAPSDSLLIPHSGTQSKTSTSHLTKVCKLSVSIKMNKVTFVNLL